MRIIIHFSRILMNTKTTITLSAAAIAASLLLFASGPLVGSQQAQYYCRSSEVVGIPDNRILSSSIWIHLTVTTLVADDDVWSLSPAKNASILCVPGPRWVKVL